MTTGRTVGGPKVPSLKGTEVSLSYVQCVLYLVSSSINVSIFHITGLDTFWTDPVLPSSNLDDPRPQGLHDGLRSPSHNHITRGVGPHIMSRF